jgi:hypothetical protein
MNTEPLYSGYGARPGMPMRHITLGGILFFASESLMLAMIKAMQEKHPTGTFEMRKVEERA